MNATIPHKTHVIVAVLMWALTFSWMAFAQLWNRLGFHLLKWQGSHGFGTAASRPRLIRVRS